MPDDRPVLRGPRAVAFATVCALASYAAHVLAGGGVVPLPQVLLGVGLAAALAWSLGGRERDLDVVFPATLATQVLLHELFSFGAPEPVTTPPGGHGHLGPGLGMALVHLMVALLSAWWLHRGEGALWLLVRLYGRRPVRLVRWIVSTPEAAPLPARPAVPEVRIGRHVWQGCAEVRRRGPPEWA